MSSCVVSTQVTGIQLLPDDAFLGIVSFLDPFQLAIAEGVCRSWKGAICSHDQQAWKEQCRLKEIHPLSLFIRKALNSLDAKTVALITEYEGDEYKKADINYKKHASILRGEIRLYPDTFYIYKGQKNNMPFLYHRWENDDDEVFACIRFSSLAPAPKSIMQKTVS